MTSEADTFDAIISASWNVARTPAEVEVDLAVELLRDASARLDAAFATARRRAQPQPTADDLSGGQSVILDDVTLTSTAEIDVALTDDHTANLALAYDGDRVAARASLVSLRTPMSAGTFDAQLDLKPSRGSAPPLRRPELGSTKMGSAST